MCAETPRARAGFLLSRRAAGYLAATFLGGTIASFTDLATRNFTTFLAGILMASPVAGLRPTRALRSARTRRPIPGRIKTPFFLVSRTASSASESMNCLATLLLTPVVSASSLTIAVWVMRFISAGIYISLGRELDRKEASALELAMLGPKTKQWKNVRTLSWST